MLVAHARCTQAAITPEGNADKTGLFTVVRGAPLSPRVEQQGGCSQAPLNPVREAAFTLTASTLPQGDQLISTSGVTYTRTEDYAGVTVRKGQQVVTLNCLSESFKTVSAAIGSHPSGMAVRLTFQRCDPSAAVTQSE